jgi:hypothetical protein
MDKLESLNLPREILNFVEDGGFDGQSFMLHKWGNMKKPGATEVNRFVQSK